VPRLEASAAIQSARKTRRRNGAHAGIGAGAPSSCRGVVRAPPNATKPLMLNSVLRLLGVAFPVLREADRQFRSSLTSYFVTRNGGQHRFDGAARGPIPAHRCDDDMSHFEILSSFASRQSHILITHLQNGTRT